MLNPEVIKNPIKVIFCKSRLNFPKVKNFARSAQSAIDAVVPDKLITLWHVSFNSAVHFNRFAPWDKPWRKRRRLSRPCLQESYRNHAQQAPHNNPSIFSQRLFNSSSGKIFRTSNFLFALSDEWRAALEI